MVNRPNNTCDACNRTVPKKIDSELEEIFGRQFCSWACEQNYNACSCCVVDDYSEDE